MSRAPVGSPPAEVAVLLEPLAAGPPADPPTWVWASTSQSQGRGLEPEAAAQSGEQNCCIGYGSLWRVLTLGAITFVFLRLHICTSYIIQISKNSHIV